MHFEFKMFPLKRQVLKMCTFFLTHLFPQAKNRELMKQVAALSKGKKFDRTGSSLLLP